MVIHVVFGLSASGHLRSSFKENEHLKGKIIIFHDDLSIGPIREFGSKERVDWHEGIFQDCEYISAKDSAKCLEDFENIKKVNKSTDEVYFWVGPNSCDELGFLRICSSLTNVKNKFIIHFPKMKVMYGKDKSYTAKCLGSFGSGNIEKILRYIKKLSFSEIKMYSKLWEELLKDKYVFRVKIGDFKVDGKKEDYFDRKILELCDLDYKPAGVIVGKIIGSSRALPNEKFISWRIRELIKSGKLLYVGDLSATRYFKVKLNM